MLHVLIINKHVLIDRNDEINRRINKIEEHIVVTNLFVIMVTDVTSQI